MYQELLRAHTRNFVIRSVDNPARSGVGMFEFHGSIPFRQRVKTNRLPQKAGIYTDEQLARDRIGAPVNPEDFPKTGYLGEGIKVV